MIRHLANEISKLKPGFRMTIDRHILHDIHPVPMVGIGGPEWNAVDQIMESIVGSAYEFRYWTDPQTGNVTFERLREPLKDGERTYVSPDKRHRAKQGDDGIWRTD
jgi:hypothetical protein